MAASQYFDQVQKLYIAYFGRPADPVGLNFWAANIDAAGGNFDAVVAGFSASSESKALYAAGTTAQLVTSVYIALFNRPPEAAGLAFWVSQIDAGTIAGARAAYQILLGAGPGDAAAIANKVAAANAFTTNVDTTAEINGYSGLNSATVARAFLSKVDATSYSISNLTADTTKAVIDATGVVDSKGVSPAAPVVGPITLTDIAANLNGKVFAASSGPGDVLNVTDAPTVPTNLALLTGFETINLSGSTGLITIANGAGITINNTGSVGVVVKLGSGGQTFNGGAGTYTVTDGSGNDTLNFGAGNYTTLPGGGVDTFNVGAGAVANLGGVGSSDTVVVSAGGTATMSPSTYIANGITLTNNGTANFINVSSINLSLATGSNGFNITGTATANTINGSSKADTFTGGTGADTFVFTTPANSSVTNFDTITDFTSGTDRIKTGVVGGATSLNQSVSYTAAGTGTLATDIAAAVAAGNAAGATHTAAANDAYLVTITGTGAGNYVFQDTNGDGAVNTNELVIKLTGTSSTTLAIGDFIA